MAALPQFRVHMSVEIGGEMRRQAATIAARTADEARLKIKAMKAFEGAIILKTKRLRAK